VGPYAIAPGNGSRAGAGMGRPGAAQRRAGTFEARPRGQGRAWL